ncbi:MAG: DNA polymerase III subunit gamma/tau [Alphaproteobacteria bacterium]|nr:DNA polymerase III subunit gamma/tau [Alphaproteobacteria bacterium]MDE2111309.1 DNA polymerase III subunit gamma/tau [Alphaproteobacteria bacterium]MDE2495885.1 DNA polymerase III subunit gamma/tau [Alphaproteobacteria bacterium]
MDDTAEPSLGLGPAPSAAGEYKVLARKYRPSDFSGLIGQEALVKTLSNAFATGRIAHAFMLTGVRGVGKTTTARIVARALNCIGPDGKRSEPTIRPCGVCDPCIAIAESRHVDVQEMDAASRTGIDDVREIIEGVRYAPASARYKVYIIDEVHMLSKQAFNGLLKTLEEPPPHVKFVFATTEIRKVPVTVLSRCQRFDLRRIETGELVAHLQNIAQKEHVKIEDAALALVARAAEGSVRDGLSLLDQAIAHGEEGTITADTIRAMLGLADRGRVLDLFEKVMSGEIAEALAQLNELYDRGADPMAVMQDLLEIAHFLTRLKVAPAAEGFFDGGSGEARRSAEMAGKLGVPSLTRAWSLLLKGLFEVRDAARPVAACEMALIRLAYAADLPPTDKLVRDLLDNPPLEAGSKNPKDFSGKSGASNPSPKSSLASFEKISTLPQGEGGNLAVASSQTATAPTLRSLEDIAALAQAKGAPVLKVHIENDMHLIGLEPGRLEFRPGDRAPKTLAADLGQKLKDWTGARWLVTVAREGGAPTLAEQKKAAKAARHERVLQEPLVRAVMDRFPGAEIVAVHDVAPEDVAAPMPEKDED